MLYMTMLYINCTSVNLEENSHVKKNNNFISCDNDIVFMKKISCLKEIHIEVWRQMWYLGFVLITSAKKKGEIEK